MKTIIIVAVIAFVAAYGDCYDVEDIDIYGIINNSDELKRFVDCVLDKGPCSKLYGSYRVITDESVQQACKKCSPQQKHSYWLFLQAMKIKFPNDYVEYRHKYDPENKYFDALESELKKYSIAF